MKYKLEADILNETDKCGDSFSCLQGDESCLCEVDHIINDRLFFIKPNNNNACNYKISFGYSFYCNCPIRKELHKLYNV